MIAVIEKVDKYPMEFLGHTEFVVSAGIGLWGCRTLEEALDKRDKINGWEVLIESRRATKANV